LDKLKIKKLKVSYLIQLLKLFLDQKRSFSHQHPHNRNNHTKNMASSPWTSSPWTGAR